MTDKVKCEIAICMDEDGNWNVRPWDNKEDAASDVAENGGTSLRTVKLTAWMAPPAVTETAISIPDEAGETKELETEAA